MGISRIGRLISLSLVLIILTGCLGPRQEEPQGELEETFFVMDTLVTVQFHAAAGKGQAVLSAIEGEMRRLESILSAHLPDSDIALIDGAAGSSPVKVSPETLEVLDTALAYAQLTDGAFDITLAPVLELYDFSGLDPQRPTQEQLHEYLPLVDWRKVKVDRVQGTVLLQERGMKIDLGGIAKGYITDAVVEIMVAHGIEYGLVNAGGDIRLLGPKIDGNPWRVGIKDPNNPHSAFFAVVEIARGAIVTSGDYERFFIADGVRYHHILDPQTGLPAHGARSVTVTAPDAELADLLGTAIFVLGAEPGLALAESLPGVEAVIWEAEGEVRWTSGLALVGGNSVDYYFKVLK